MLRSMFTLSSSDFKTRVTIEEMDDDFIKIITNRDGILLNLEEAELLHFQLGLFIQLVQEQKVEVTEIDPTVFESADEHDPEQLEDPHFEDFSDFAHF